jgi:hypothetical protein
MTLIFAGQYIPRAGRPAQRQPNPGISGIINPGQIAENAQKPRVTKLLLF